MKRDDIVIVAPAGEFGKPRPALVIQTDLSAGSGMLTFIPITSDLLRAPLIRVPLNPTPENGLRIESEAMVDMIQTTYRHRVGKVVGHLDGRTLKRVESALLIHLGLI